MEVTGVIPARYNSSRLPGKPLLEICGKPIIWWVYQQVIKEKKLTDVVVAADDKRIVNKCNELGMKVLLTGKYHDTPTSRLCEVAENTASEFFLLVMGDEPLVDPKCFSLIIPDNKIEEEVGGGGENLCCRIDQYTY